MSHKINVLVVYLISTGCTFGEEPGGPLLDTTEAAAAEQSRNHSKAAAGAAAAAAEAGQGSGSLKECCASTHTWSHPRRGLPQHTYATVRAADESSKAAGQ